MPLLFTVKFLTSAFYVDKLFLTVIKFKLSNFIVIYISAVKKLPSTTTWLTLILLGNSSLLFNYTVADKLPIYDYSDINELALKLFPVTFLAYMVIFSASLYVN